MNRERYARQIAIASIGAPGQEQLSRAEAEVSGDGRDALIAALYLAGAGVGSLLVHDRWVEDVQPMNPEVAVRGGARAGELEVVLPLGEAIPVGPGDAVARGAEAARQALLRVIEGRAS